MTEYSDADADRMATLIELRTLPAWLKDGLAAHHAGRRGADAIIARQAEVARLTAAGFDAETITILLDGPCSLRTVRYDLKALRMIAGSAGWG
jgi:hypothetical protein